MGPIWDLFKAALGLAVDVSRNMVTAYWKFLKRLAKWSIIVALVLLPFPIIGSLLHFSWMSGIYLAVIGLLITIWLVAAFPIVMLMRYGYEEIKSIKKTAQLIGGILFWILLLSIYFYLIPVWNYPSAIPLVFIMCTILALGFMRFGIGINPKLAIGVVFTIFFLITISFYMPTSRSAANTFVGWLDRQFAGFITSPLNPAPQIPKRIGYDYISIEKIVFFDPLTSEPKVWYYKEQNGRFELFDGPGYHPQYKVKLDSITPDIVTQIRAQLKANEEIIAEPRVPERINYDHTSIETIVFFDPVTADPKVWYYKGDDGRVDLFDGPGYHPQYKEKLQPITPDIVAQIKKQVKTDADRTSEEAKKEQPQKIAKQKPGAALLEIFKADSMETIPSVPVIRTYWERDLAYSGSFFLPDRFSEIGRNSPYVARISFYYEAKETGEYGFTVVNDRQNFCKLTVAGVDVVKVGTDRQQRRSGGPMRGERDNKESGQGVCNLAKGFHRVEFWLFSFVPGWYEGKEGYNRSEAAFRVKVLTPNAFDSVPFTRDMMFLKKE